MNEIVIKKSTRKDKKYMAVLPDDKKIHFGAKGYEDYTMHHDEKRKENYLKRHKHDPKSITTAGGLSRDILWNKMSI